MSYKKNYQLTQRCISTICFLVPVFLLLFFRNTRMFVWPEPWIEDGFIFFADEYRTGFPQTAFMEYQGYIHFLPRIIAWFSMKFCLTDTMRAMNCTVLLIKILTFYMIWKSKEIGSVLVKFSLLAYLVLMPFCDELYTNITNLQWWLIYLMIIVFMRHETSLTGLLLSCSLLALSGLTGVNSVLLTVPCAYMVLRLRTKNCLIKVFVIIVCALVQLYYVHSTPRVGGKLYGNVFDIIDMFVNRVIYHSLFNFNTRSWINIPVFLCYILVLLINLWYYRRLLAVQFVALFSSVYTVAIFYTLMLQTFSPLEVAIQGFAHERYFVFLRVCSFVLPLTFPTLYPSQYSPTPAERA